MLERANDARRNREVFLRNIIGQRVVDIFNAASARSVHSHEFHEGSIEGLFQDYFEADKQLGAVDEERLMVISAMSLAYVTTDSVPRFFKLNALELGASALHEAAFVQSVASHNSIDTVDERLELIEAADRMLGAALQLAKPGSERSHRIALQHMFTPVHMDIVSGEVTIDTVQDVREQLTNHRLSTHRMTDKKAARGLLGEIETLQHFWNKYEKQGQPVAIPATMRGGSGRSNREQTHDIDVVRQKVDGSWVVLTPIEVKRAAITEAIKRRYTRSLLANVNSRGEVTITGDHRERTAQ